MRRSTREFIIIFILIHWKWLEASASTIANCCSSDFACDGKQPAPDRSGKMLLSVAMLLLDMLAYSSDGAWGIVRSSIFTSSYHHPPYPFFTIIFHPPYHQEKSHPSTHFMHPSHYHFSTPFFFTFISSFFFLINHLLLSSHHHLNYAPCPFIEFRLVKNIDTLISKKKCINARCQKQFIYTANGLQSAFFSGTLNGVCVSR